MALPPIVTNSSIYRALLGGVQSRQDKQAKSSPVTGASGAASADTVAISEQAAAKLRAENLRQQEQARETARDVRDTIARNAGLTLSADPGRLPAA